MSQPSRLETNISNYLGNYQENKSYAKFDFVYNEKDKLFYYAKEDISFGEENTINEPLRFTLDPNGPIYGGLQTYYIYDYRNNIQFLKKGQKIVLSNTQHNNNGSFLIIEIQENYSERDVSPGDFILTEVLDATERLDENTFDSEWFLAGVNEFDWGGRDWEEYVLQSLDLKNAFEEDVNNGYSESIRVWGKNHYENFGEAENRTIPLTQAGNDIWVNWLSNTLEMNIVGLNDNNSRNSLNPNDKSAWFKFKGFANLLCFTKKSLNSSQNKNGLVWFEDSTKKTREHVFYKTNIDVDLVGSARSEFIENIKFSLNGQKCVIKKQNSIEIYHTPASGAQEKTWDLLSSIQVGSNFLLSAVSDDCSHIAYCTWPGTGVVADLQLNSGGSGWLNGRSSGIQNDITQVDANGYLIGAIISATGGRLELKLQGSISQDGVAGSEGSFNMEVKSGTVTSISWITKPTFLSNEIPLSFSYQVYAKWSISLLTQNSSFVPLAQIANYTSRVSPYITASNAIGSGLNISIFNPIYFSNADINSGAWLSDPDYSVSGYLTIMSLKEDLSGYEQKHYEPGFFYSVGNFTRDNKKLILGSHNWSKSPEDSESHKGRIMIIDVDNFNFDLDIRARKGSLNLSDLHLSNDRFFLYDEFLPVSKKVKNPVVLSADGNWFSFIDSFKKIYLFKKIDGQFKYIASDQVVVNYDSTVSISGNNKMLIVTNGGIDSWYIHNHGDPELIRMEKIPSPPVNFSQENLDGTIDWGSQEYQVSSSVYPERQNWIREAIVSKNGFGRTRIFVSSQSHPDFYRHAYAYDTDSKCAVFDFDEDARRWDKVSLDNLPNFYWMTHIGGNETLEEIMTINLKPTSNYPDLYYSFELSNERGLFVAEVQDVNNYIFNKQQGWSLWERASSSQYAKGYAFEIYVPDEDGNAQWWSLKQGQTSASSFERSIRNDTPSDYQSYVVTSNDEREEYKDNSRQTRLWVRGYTQDDKINNFENRSNNTISIQTENRVPGEGGLSGWTTNEFFFDPDYGSTVNYSASNFKQDCANGYYTLQPKNINSLNYSVDLSFKNRSNSESNAIIHFLENHLGQHESSKLSNNLTYNQGISGFYWGGDSTFHPYDTTKTQSLKFYCFDFSHDLKFEDSNDIKLKLSNLNFSTLRMKDGGFVRKAEDYNAFDFYNQNDVVFVEEVNRYYYYINEEPSAGIKPFRSFNNESGLTTVQDINPDYWTRKFKWKPSLGLSFNQKPRVKRMSMGKGYTQVYNDGINESLLNFEVKFKNRDDAECRAILHFLEQHKGSIPFEFKPPAPYDKDRSFVCQRWSHNYVYKNNHTITAKFEEFPIFLTADQRDSGVMGDQPYSNKKAKLIFTSPILIRKQNDFGTFGSDKKYRARAFVKNIGGEPLAMYNFRAVAKETDDVGFEGDFSINGLKDFDYAMYTSVYVDLEIHRLQNFPDWNKYTYGKWHWQKFGNNEPARRMPIKQFNFSREFLSSEKTYELIDEMYVTMLGRNGESEGINSWLNNSDYIYMEDLQYTFMDSDEYKWKHLIYDDPTFYDDNWRNAVPTETSANFASQIILGRNLSSAELQNTYLVQPANINVWAIMRGTDEFFTRVGLEVEYGINPTQCAFTEKGLTQDEFIITLPSFDQKKFVNLKNYDDSINLYGRKIKIRKNGYREGMEGGLSFDLLNSDLTTAHKYIQRNDGVIYSVSDTSISLKTDYYINEEFIILNASNMLQPGEEKIFEVVFDSFEDDNAQILATGSGDEIMYFDGSQTSNIVVSSATKKYLGRVYIRSSAGEVGGDVLIYTS